MVEHKVLVVGGSGYIGGAVTDYLKDNRVDFIVYDNLMYERDYRKNVPFMFGDVLDTQKLLALIEEYEPTAIIWLAAVVGDGACQTNPEMTVAVNQEAVRWLTENYDGKIVFTSTCSVYGKQDKVLDEASDTNPLSLYAQTKLQAEEFLKDKNAIIFRLGTLHGISDEFSRIRLDLVVNILAMKAVRGEPLTVFGGSQWRPILHVKDAALAIVDAAINPNIVPGIYNLAYKNRMIKELATDIKEMAPISVKITYSDISFEDARNYKVSNEKYKRQLGVPIFERNARMGAREIMLLLKDGRIKDPMNKVFHNANHMKEAMKNG
ncbi:MAG: SDR family oxidoreductase [bacterium]|nr:SDR family oxidoreductase [bacterium]